jgi:hypothetical protein
MINPSLQSKGARQPTRHFFKFLTPRKVLVLILVHAYCASLVPPKYNAAVFKLLLDQIEVTLLSCH